MVTTSRSISGETSVCDRIVHRRSYRAARPASITNSFLGERRRPADVTFTAGASDVMTGGVQMRKTQSVVSYIFRQHSICRGLRAKIALRYARFWLDLDRRLARLPSRSVCPALLVPARLVSHAPAARAAARRFACACRARPSVHPSHARAHTSRQSYHGLYGSTSCCKSD